MEVFSILKENSVKSETRAEWKMVDCKADKLKAKALQAIKDTHK